MTIAIKVVIIGDSGVGKSQLLRRFADDEFRLDTKATIGVEFASRDLCVSGIHQKLQIWDTAGQERYRAMTPSLYRNAAGCLLVFDLTKRVSFQALHKWIEELRGRSNNAKIVLVGNKLDLENLRQVTTSEAKIFADLNGLDYVETSALDGRNINDAFNILVTEVLEGVSGPESPITGSIKIKKPQGNRIRCCRL